MFESERSLIPMASTVQALGNPMLFLEAGTSRVKASCPTYPRTHESQGGCQRVSRNAFSIQYFFIHQLELIAQILDNQMKMRCPKLSHTKQKVSETTSKIRLVQ